MCWKYEDDYQICFDGSSEQWGLDMHCVGQSLINLLRNCSCEVDEKEGMLRDEWYDFLSRLHEKGIISPMTSDRWVKREQCEDCGFVKNLKKVE